VCAGRPADRTRAAELDNRTAARALRELAARLELEGVPHAPRAYRRAADAVEREPRGIAAIRAAEGLEQLPGVGSHIARTLCELLDTGTISRLERLRHEAPVDVVGLLAVDGIGPKRLKTL